jgi:hypothetical protein
MGQTHEEAREVLRRYGIRVPRSNPGELLIMGANPKRGRKRVIVDMPDGKVVQKIFPPGRGSTAIRRWIRMMEQRGGRVRVSDVIRNPGELLIMGANQRPRRNPGSELDGAEALYRKFHGKDPREIVEVQQSAEERKDYTALGDLHSLRLVSPSGEQSIEWPTDRPKLASNAEGTQLYIIGGDQDLSSDLARFGSDISKDLVELGEVSNVVYVARKAQSNFSEVEWDHEFGEEGGEPPIAFFDKLKRRIFLVGGTYRVEEPGIVN